MNNFFELPQRQQRLVLEECRNRMGLPEQAIEKDLWVTVVLQLLFDSELKDDMIFKGGTSLSKAGGLIERFSEDIDLAVNPSLFGLEGELTKKQLKKLRKSSSLFVREKLSEVLRRQIARYGLDNRLNVEVEEDGEGDRTYPEPRLLYVAYKSLLPRTIEYIKPVVILEAGARSLMEPVMNLSLKSIVEERIPTMETSICNVDVITATPAKTFVEKAFLLHELFSIERTTLPADRKSRHLYDLSMMMDRDFAIKAVSDDRLWEAVRHHRETFTSLSGVDYACDIRDNIKLIPPEKFLEGWKADYQLMATSMIYGDKPDWNELLDRIGELELRLRNHYDR